MNDAEKAAWLAANRLPDRPRMADAMDKTKGRKVVGAARTKLMHEILRSG